jgi:hypothetical protein
MVDRSPVVGEIQSQPEPTPTAVERPNRTLATERITFQKQLILIRAYASAGGQAVQVAAAAQLAKLTETTASLANAFFTDVGFLERTAAGFVPAAEVVSFHRAVSWNAETAPQKLAPILRRTWFATLLLRKLGMGPIPETEAMADLADAAAAAPKYQPNLRILIDYLEASGLIRRDNGMLREGALAVDGERGARVETTATPEPASTATKGTPSVTTSFAQGAEGIVHFHVEVRVGMGEFSTWSPDRISAFFGGLAQVLAAKGAVEEESAGR